MMATIANWNGHTLVVSSSLIRSFTALTIKGSCETTTKNSDKQKYEEHKYGEAPTIEMTLPLNAQTGVTDVRAEAMQFVTEATEGASAYFYMGSAKLIPAEMMLISAEVTEVVIMPGKGDTWISCEMKLSFKQGTKSDGGGSSGSGGGSSSGGGKTSVKTSTAVKDPQAEIKNPLTGLPENAKTIQARVDKLTAAAKERSKQAKNEPGATMENYAAQAEKKIATKDTLTKVEMTTGKTCDFTNTKISLAGKLPAINTDTR